MTLTSISGKMGVDAYEAVSSYFREKRISGYLESLAYGASGLAKAAHAAGIATVSSFINGSKDEQKEQVWSMFFI